MATSHRSVIGLFGLHVVRAGLVDREWGRSLAQEYEDRLTSDYDAEAAVEAPVAEQRVADAKRFVRQLERALQELQETA